MRREAGLSTGSRPISPDSSQPPGKARPKGAPSRKPGPALDLERVRHAATLAFEGARLKDIGRDMRVDAKTLWRWEQLPEWAETTAELARQVCQQVVPLAHQVLVRALRADLGLRGPRPNPKLALEVLDRFDPAVIRGQGHEGNDYAGGARAGGWYVEYPPRDQGLESKPATQVLLPLEPPPPVGRKGKPVPRNPGPVKRRRVAGPDE